MDGLTKATLGLVAATLLLACVTAWLVYVTWRASRCQLRVQTWLEMAKRFDSSEVRRARRELAKQIQSYSVEGHDGISERSWISLKMSGRY